MAQENAIGEFLRARRQLVRPSDVGVPDLGQRRVSGLRREEMAMLAGVSVDYYVRLEQGRDRHPSEQVLEALARALLLDEEASAHLHQLGRAAPRRRRSTPRPERLDPHVERLVARWADTPAYVLGRYWDVLAANQLAGALHPGYTPGVNLLRTIFLDREARAFYVNWDRIAQGCVAALRATAAPDLDDPRLVELVGELSLGSETFARLWARHDVRGKTRVTKHLNHPIVGELELDFVSFSINGTLNQQLIVYQAQPGSASAQSLALLSMATAHPQSTAATLPPPTGAHTPHDRLR